jgi:hypothetical protein
MSFNIIALCRKEIITESLYFGEVIEFYDFRNWNINLSSLALTNSVAGVKCKAFPQYTVYLSRTHIHWNKVNECIAAIIRCQLQPALLSLNGKLSPDGVDANASAMVDSVAI